MTGNEGMREEGGERKCGHCPEYDRCCEHYAMSRWIEKNMRYAKIETLNKMGRLLLDDIAPLPSDKSDGSDKSDKSDKTNNNKGENR